VLLQSLATIFDKNFISPCPIATIIDLSDSPRRRLLGLLIVGLASPLL